MSLKVPDVGELKLIDKLMTAYGNTCLLHLFQNNYTPVDGTVIGDLTEATFTGYAVITITGWGAAATVAGRATSTATQQTFAHNGGATSNNIYGYYVTDAGGNLLWAERDPNSPVPMANGSQTYSITPKFTGATEF